MIDQMFIFFIQITNCKTLQEAAAKKQLPIEILVIQMQLLEETLGFSIFQSCEEKDIHLTLKGQILFHVLDERMHFIMSKMCRQQTGETEG